MKKSAAIVIVAFLLASAGTLSAQQTNEEKVICELAAKNCLNKVDIVQKRINKINAEIRKGSRKYSAEELKKLDQKLQEAKELLDKLEGTPSKK